MLAAIAGADVCLTGLQDSGEAMGLVLDQAMGTGLKPPVVLLGATLPQGLAADASNRVSSPVTVLPIHLASPLLCFAALSSYCPPEHVAVGSP